MSFKSNFVLVRHEPEKFVLIEDVGPWDQFMSVTNDAENVVIEMAKHYALDRIKLFYIDSEGVTSELKTKDGKFLSYAPAPEGLLS